MPLPPDELSRAMFRTHPTDPALPPHLRARVEKQSTMDRALADAVRAGVQAMLVLAGRDPGEPDLVDTPDRFLRAWVELATSPSSAGTILGTTFEGHGSDQMVHVGPIPFASMCEHHLLPFTGTVHFAYVPGQRIVGLSKIPRLVQHLASRPQVQERLTRQIVDTFQTFVPCAGVAVHVRAVHLCATLRGVRTPAPMTTTALLGVFKDEPEARAEFFATARNGHPG